MTRPTTYPTAAAAAAAGPGAVEVLIGMRWEHLWRLAAHPWVPWAFVGMLRSKDPMLVGSGLAVRARGLGVTQRWAGAEPLDQWAREPSDAHGPAAQRFRREHGRIAGWGIWHEVRHLP